MTVVACHLPPFGVGTFMACNSSAAFRADSADRPSMTLTESLGALIGLSLQFESF